jgi:hypothetical protein
MAGWGTVHVCHNIKTGWHVFPNRYDVGKGCKLCIFINCKPSVMNDLLSTFLSGEVAETYVRKIYKLMGVIGIFTVLWTLINLLELYKFFYDRPDMSKVSHPFYRYTLLPAVTIAQIALNITWIVLLYRGWGNLKSYIETSDDNLLHNGLKNFFMATALLAVWFVIAIVTSFYGMFTL